MGQAFRPHTAKFEQILAIASVLAIIGVMKNIRLNHFNNTMYSGQEESVARRRARRVCVAGPGRIFIEMREYGI